MGLLKLFFFVYFIFGLTTNLILISYITYLLASLQRFKAALELGTNIFQSYITKSSNFGFEGTE